MPARVSSGSSSHWARRASGRASGAGGSRVSSLRRIQSMVRSCLRISSRQPGESRFHCLRRTATNSRSCSGICASLAARWSGCIGRRVFKYQRSSVVRSLSSRVSDVMASYSRTLARRTARERSEREARAVARAESSIFNSLRKKLTGDWNSSGCVEVGEGGSVGIAGVSAAINEPPSNVTKPRMERVLFMAAITLPPRRQGVRRRRWVVRRGG